MILPCGMIKMCIRDSHIPMYEYLNYSFVLNNLFFQSHFLINKMHLLENPSLQGIKVLPHIKIWQKNILYRSQSFGNQPKLI